MKLKKLFLALHSKNKQKSMIDLQKIIDTYGVEPSEAAALLFPNNRHPELSLKRILKGESELSASQIKILAQRLHVSVSDLYDDAHLTRVSPPGSRIRVEVGENWASVDFAMQTVTVYSSMHDVAEQHAYISPAITLKEIADFIQQVGNQ